MVNPGHVIVMSLVVSGSMLPAARIACAQTFEPGIGGGLVTAREVRRTIQPVRRFDLTLEEAVRRAVERNLDIAVQRIRPLVQDVQVAIANAGFLPTASSGFGLNESTQPSRSLLDGGGLGGQSILIKQRTYDVGIDQQVKWGGGRYSLTWNSNRLESTDLFTSFNPSLGANMTAEYTQPLLRGFRTDPRRTQLVVSRINREISDIDLEETIINTLADVGLAYWELVYARAAVGVQQEALELAERLVRDNRARVEIGMIGEIEVVQAQAEAALRRQLLAEAGQVQRTNELALKRLIVGGTSDELWSAEINPTDEPQLAPMRIDVDEAIRETLARRTDISRARRQLAINDATVANLRNSTLPALDLVGAYQLAGQGGPRLIPAGNSFDAILGGAGVVIPGGYGDVLGNIAGADYPTWNVQIRMTYPLGRSAEEGAYERARLELQQTLAQIKQIELRIASDVANAALQIDAIQERIGAAVAARELAEEQLRGEEIRFEVGLSTNYLVVQMQRDLTTALNAELRAVLDYQRALIEFDRIRRTSLAAAGISIIAGGQ